eukprot:evm.model.scf_2232.1 EVM.evm.TU.scf_2232.1   scf_2232:7797-8876(+)
MVLPPPGTRQATNAPFTRLAGHQCVVIGTVRSSSDGFGWYWHVSPTGRPISRDTSRLAAAMQHFLARVGSCAGPCVKTPPRSSRSATRPPGAFNPRPAMLPSPPTTPPAGLSGQRPEFRDFLGANAEGPGSDLEAFLAINRFTASLSPPQAPAENGPRSGDTGSLERPVATLAPDGPALRGAVMELLLRTAGSFARVPDSRGARTHKFNSVRITPAQRGVLDATRAVLTREMKAQGACTCAKGACARNKCLMDFISSGAVIGLLLLASWRPGRQLEGVAALCGALEHNEDVLRGMRRALRASQRREAVLRTILSRRRRLRRKRLVAHKAARRGTRCRAQARRKGEALTEARQERQGCSD